MYDKVIKIQKDCAEAYYNKANNLYTLDRKEEALNYYNLAIKYNSQDADFYYNKGLILTKLGRVEEAGKIFDEYKRLHSKK